MIEIEGGVCNCTDTSPLLISCSWRRDPGGIGPGHPLTGRPHTHPRASGGLMELCCTPRGTKTTLVYRAGKSLPAAHSFHYGDLEREQKHLSILGLMFPSLPCSSLFPPLCVFLRQWLHDEGAALQDARAREPQWEPGQPKPRQRLFPGLRQQGLQPRLCPGWWGQQQEVTITVWIVEM